MTEDIKDVLDDVDFQIPRNITGHKVGFGPEIVSENVVHTAYTPAGGAADLYETQEGTLIRNTKGKYFDRRIKRTTKLRSTVHLTALLEFFVEQGGADPMWTLMEIAAGHKLTATEEGFVKEEFKKQPDFKTRAFAAAELMSFVYPKRKSVEVSGKDQQPMQFMLNPDMTPPDSMPTPEEVAAYKAARIEEMRNKEVNQVSNSES